MREKNLGQALNNTLLLCCLLHVIQGVQDNIQDAGVKYNHMLKNRSKMFNDELEKELLFLHRSFNDEQEEKLFYKKINKICDDIKNTLKDFEFDAI
jgi:hypothetical protein